MSNIIIYHNPRCSKSRQALALLEEKHIKPKIVEYLKAPLTEQELKHIIKLLGISPKELLRKNEKEYKKLDLANSQYTDEDILKLMVKHPILIERPIIIAGHKAVVGRPPEKILAII